MTVQRYQVFGWANPVEGGDGPFGGVYVKESDYDALAARLAEARWLLTSTNMQAQNDWTARRDEWMRATDSAEHRETV